MGEECLAEEEEGEGLATRGFPEEEEEGSLLEEERLAA